MPNICNLYTPFIPQISDEPLWEWYIPTDALFLSAGAIKQLKLEKVPETMTEFYNLLPADAALELAASREEAISGRGGSTSHCGYLYDGMWLREYFMVLTRDSNGRATRVMGRIEADASSAPMGFSKGQEMIFGAGLWLYDVSAGKIWRDPICDSILGIAPGMEYPINASESILAVHPSERNSLQRHYKLFCESPFLGDSITDIVRVRHANGEYVPVLARATALQRDENGCVRLVLGLMAHGEPQLAAVASIEKDGQIFHVLNNMGTGNWNWDTKKDSIYFCPRYLAMLGYTQDQEGEFAENWRQHIHPDDRDKVARVHEIAIASPDQGDTFECTYRMARAEGGWAWLFDRGYVTWRDETGRAGHIIGSITNITTAQAERERLEELIRHDTLTGLRSRAFCKLEIEHIEHNNLRPVSIISVDITGLKMINDYLGHARGDELLISASQIMRRGLRVSDCIGRFGGDEFIIILPGCDLVKGMKVMEKLKRSFTAYNARHPEAPVFAAIGMAAAESCETSMAQVMAEADEKMYEHKKEQRKNAHAVLKKLIFEATGRVVGADERIVDN